MRLVYEEYLYRDLEILFRFIPKSGFTLIFVVLIYLLVEVSNYLRELQINFCLGQLIINKTTTLSGDFKSSKCFETIKPEYISCEKDYQLIYLDRIFIVGRLIGLILGYKSDTSSPQKIIFRCIFVKIIFGFLFYTNYIFLGDIFYIYDLLSGYVEGAILCAGQALIAQWTSKYITVFSTVLTSCFLLRDGICLAIMKLLGIFLDLKSHSQVQILLAGTLLIFALLWNYFIFDSPKDHPYITEKEKMYILKKSNCCQDYVYSIPWINILTNKYFYIHLFVTSASLLQISFFVSIINSTICSDENFEVFERNYYYKWLALYSGAFISSLLADIIISCNLIDIDGLRKIFFLVSVFSLVPYFYFYMEEVAFYDNKLKLSGQYYLILSLFMNGFFFSSIVCQHFDFSPTFAASLASIAMIAELTTGTIAREIHIYLLKYFTYMSKYMFFYGLFILCVMIPVMIINTSFNSHTLQDYNNCTWKQATKKPPRYPVNLKYH